jgi:hypothetical protein
LLLAVVPGSEAIDVTGTWEAHFLCQDWVQGDQPYRSRYDGLFRISQDASRVVILFEDGTGTRYVGVAVDDGIHLNRGRLGVFVACSPGYDPGAIEASITTRSGAVSGTMTGRAIFANEIGHTYVCSLSARRVSKEDPGVTCP